VLRYFSHHYKRPLKNLKNKHQLLQVRTVKNSIQKEQELQNLRKTNTNRYKYVKNSTRKEQEHQNLNN
jgi:hypothetical protein